MEGDEPGPRQPTERNPWTELALLLVPVVLAVALWVVQGR